MTRSADQPLCARPVLCELAGGFLSHEKSPWELYDLAGDGMENTDLASRHPDIVSRLAARWQTWAMECNLKAEPK